MTFLQRAFWGVVAYSLAIALMIGIVKLGMAVTGASP